MLDNQIDAATFRIQCGQEFGTAWLVSAGTLITALHCVLGAVNDGEEISVFRPHVGDAPGVKVQIIAHDADLDVCLLSMSDAGDIAPMHLSVALPRPGSLWHSIGFPQPKAKTGHRVSGTIGQALETPVLRVDLDLGVGPDSALNTYSGLSGAAVMVDGACVGVLRLKVDRTLGALSLHAMSPFLAQHGILSLEESDETPLTSADITRAERFAFQAEFEASIDGANGRYLFLEGAHGIGKTTFCSEFRPQDPKFLVLGTYRLGAHDREAGPIVRAQPEMFFDWLLTAITALLTQRPARKKELTYLSMVQEAGQLLASLAQHCLQHSQHAVIFVDGINEGLAADAAALGKLLGLLPLRLPAGVTVVLTAPNYTTVARAVSGHVGSSATIALPRLSEAACRSYCARQLSRRQFDATLIDQICDKAQGHPLYLRYLIEFINGNDDGALDQFPTLAGAIEDYYESVWVRLLHDPDAVNLLAIIARLRWGISTDDMIPLLLAGERAVFVPTMSRIRHLLHHQSSTEIYHSSFAEFISLKTAAMDQVIHQRTAEWCASAAAPDYCRLNVLFHYLRAGSTAKTQAVARCQQAWVDDCVLIGVEPDDLLADVAEVLSAAIELGQGVEIIRLLLLQQRVAFRYNVLFAQSAHLLASAMVALQRPDEAIKFLIRFDTLLVTPNDAWDIAFRLAVEGHDQHAFKILNHLHRLVADSYNDESAKTVDEFIALIRMLIRIRLLAQMIDGESRVQSVARILRSSHEALHDTLSEVPGALLRGVARIQSVVSSLHFYMNGTYTPLRELRRRSGGITPPAYLLTLLGGLHEYGSLIDDLGSPDDKPEFADLFSDLQELMATGDALPGQVSHAALATLQDFNAPVELVQDVAAQLPPLEPGQILVIEKNGVDISHADILQQMAEWRAKYYLEHGQVCPIIPPATPTGWKPTVEQLLRAVAWFEGRSRRATVEADGTALSAAFKQFSRQILPALYFELGKRAKWQESYAIPEGVLPIIWRHVAIALRDTHPMELPRFLRDLADRAHTQLGLYTEGFRECLREIVSTVVDAAGDNALGDALFALLDQWRHHVVSCVENRHELVPELLALIPLFVKMGAQEEAKALFQRVLSVSMGPTWYKEDQFGLMSTTLEQLPSADPLDGKLSMIAGYLQRASGEMTFQRFIRYEKTGFLEELIRRDMYAQGCRYFTRLSYGTLAELTDDRRMGQADRISDTTGMHHPGGALDEQHAVLSLVRRAHKVDWRLRWAILEIFQCGDRRHLADFALKYAKIIESLAPSAISEAFERMDAVIGAEVSMLDREEFLGHFSHALDARFSSEFEVLAQKYLNAGMPATSEQTQELERQSVENGTVSRSREDDALLMPGTFGTQASLRESKALVAAAERQIERRNVEAAKTHAIQTLESLQNGGWSIWTSLASSDARRAERLLQRLETDANTAIKRYGALIENEQYEPRWRIAGHLIALFTGKFPLAERLQILDHVLDHVRLMVGESNYEAAQYQFLDAEDGKEPDQVLLGFVQWLTEHPSWLRRSNAARALLWLIEDEPRFFNEAARSAFSNVSGTSADLGCGVLDAMSSRDALHTWSRLGSVLDWTQVVDESKHLNRLAVLRRIAGRAAKHDANAAHVVSRIDNRLRAGAIELSAMAEDTELPQWAECVSRELYAIEALGLLSRELLTRIEDELSTICSPLNIKEAMELENAVANTFREPWPRALDRWEGKVREALAKALLPYASQRNLQHLEEVLRICNPYVPERTMCPGFMAPGASMIQAIEGGGNYSAAIGNADSFYLNYFETFLVHEQAPSRSKPHIIETFAILLPSSMASRTAFGAAMQSTVYSRHYAEFSASRHLGATCLRLEPDFAYLGSYTPALPTPWFLEQTGISRGELTRLNWRNGRSSEVHECGRPESEGCYLAVKRSALQVPHGMRMAWVIRLDGELTAVVDANNQRLG